MKYLVRSAIGLVAYIVIVLVIHFLTYTSSMEFAEYRGLITSLPSQLGEPTSRGDIRHQGCVTNF